MSSRTHKLEPEKVIKVNRNKQSVPAIAFLFKDQHVITLSHDGSLQVIETRTGTLVGNPWQYDKEKSQVCAVDISPDGGRVATGSKDGKIRVWKWNGRIATMLVESEKHGAAANCVCWSRHDGGAYIASGFDDGSVTVWPSSGLKYPMRTGDTRLRYIHAINFSHDGTQLLVSGYDREISRLTVDKRAREVQLNDVVKICNNPNHVSSATWATTTDGHAVVTGLTDGKIMIFELSEGRLLELKGLGHSDLVCAVALFPDKPVLASASHDCTLRFWDLHAKQTIGQPLQLSADLTCAAFAANGTLVATGTCDGEVYIWDIADFLSRAIPMEDLNDRDGDVTARPSFDPKSPIPHRQHTSEARPQLPSIPASPVAPRRERPIVIPSNFFDGVPAAGVNAPTPSVKRRFFISRHVKVPVSRHPREEQICGPRAVEIPVTIASFGGIQKDSRRNHHPQRVEGPGRQQSGAPNKPTTQDTIVVRRTPWVNALLRMGCIPVDLSKSMESY